MDTRPLTTATLAASVIAVPPLARTSSLAWNHAENERQIRHLEAGGVRTLLYGGNAVLGHVALSEYAELLERLSDAVASDTLVIPSVGPGYGMMMDQAEILRQFDFPTAMLLPLREGTTSAGIAVGFRRFVERVGRPGVLYLKHDGAMDVDHIARLVRDGLVSWVKYAIVRPDPTVDSFLQSLIDAIGPQMIVSGMGEQPALVHLRQFGLPAFTSGCVCVAPRLSMNMLQAAQRGDDGGAERIRAIFKPLESLRDAINPVRVLHAAVRLSGVADTGPITPLLSAVTEEQQTTIREAVEVLLQYEQAARRSIVMS